MKTKLKAMAAVILAGAACLLTATSAPAARIIKPILGGPFDSVFSSLGTISAIRLFKANTYDFTFTIAGVGDTLSQIQASVIGPPAVAEPIQFTLYSGLPGSGISLDSTGYLVAPSLSATLSPGAYYLEVLPTQIAMNRELLTGGLEVDAIPEPGSWALLVMGVGAAGATLRSARRRRLYAAA